MVASVLLDGIADPDVDWRYGANCRGAGRPLYSRSVRGRKIAIARFCNDCTVREQCLQAALRRGERHGIWGGMSPGRRARLLRTQEHAEPPREWFRPLPPKPGGPVRDGAGRQCVIQAVAARYVGVDKTTLRQWEKDGKVSTGYDPGVVMALSTDLNNTASRYYFTDELDLMIEHRHKDAPVIDESGRVVLNLMDAARVAGVSYVSVMDWAKKGRISFGTDPVVAQALSKTSRSRKYYFRDELEQIAEQRKHV